MNTTNFQKTAFQGTAFLMSTGALILIAAHGKDFLSTTIGVSFLILWTIWWLLAFSLRSQPFFPGDKKRTIPYAVLYGSVIGLTCFDAPWEYLHFNSPIPRDGWLSWIGVGVIILSMILLTTTMWVNGGFLDIRSMVEKEYYFVTKGPYRYVRYPGYLSVLLFMAGCALCLSSLMAWAALIITLLFSLYQIRQDEQQMQKIYANRFLKIKNRAHWVLIPGIY
jgi:protein-S-isoprenylcysteine O-methyltransferase Ste14